MSDRLKKARRVVVKIGSGLLVEQGRIKAKWLASLAADLAVMRQRGCEVVIVSSGAIAIGRTMLELPAGRLKLEHSQAAAAVGQIALAQAWQQALADQNMIAGQVLLTLSDTELRRRYLNARATLFTLLKQGAVPVINENDTVATSEIRYGDNDRLAARVTSMISADCLVLLSDVDGLYTAVPGSKGAEHLAEIAEVTPEIMAMAGSEMSEYGSGGMITKLEAARIATGAGADMVIASGLEMNPLAGIENGGRASWFAASTNPVAARKRWIAGTLVPMGSLRVDDGAVSALKRGKSLLPAGITAVEGDFSRGDAVRVVGFDDQEIARGLVAYDKSEAQRIIGRQSHEIADLLGFQGRDEMVHRDDLVLLGAGIE